MPDESVKPRQTLHRMQINSLNLHAMEYNNRNYFHAGVLSGMTSKHLLRSY